MSIASCTMIQLLLLLPFLIPKQLRVCCSWLECSTWNRKAADQLSEGVRSLLPEGFPSSKWKPFNISIPHFPFFVGRVGMRNREADGHKRSDQSSQRRGRQHVPAVRPPRSKSPTKRQKRTIHYLRDFKVEPVNHWHQPVQPDAGKCATKVYTMKLMDLCSYFMEWKKGSSTLRCEHKSLSDVLFKNNVQFKNVPPLRYF